MLHCELQENCAHYTNGTKRKVHHIRISDICKLLENGMCLEQHDIKQGPACNLKKVRRLKGK